MLGEVVAVSHKFIYSINNEGLEKCKSFWPFYQQQQKSTYLLKLSLGAS